MKNKIYAILPFLFIFFITSVFASPTPVVIDDADLLTDNEEYDITKLLEDYREKHNFDIAIVTESTLSDYSAQSRADNLFDYNDYGTGTGDNGILLYLSSNPREYALTTHGSGLSLFSDDAFDYLEDEFLPYLKNDNYYEAFFAYANAADEILSESYNTSPPEPANKDFTGMILVVLLLPLIIAFILTYSKEKQMHTAQDNNYASDYIKNGINLEYSRDFFLYSTVTRIRKAKQNNGSHTSASGRTHGGRSGKY